MQTSIRSKMSQWQVPRWSKASRVPLGFHVHPAAGVLVHYSTAAAAPAAEDGSRSFSLPREKHTLQQLNGRLATYLQQVQCLAAANQRLEQQIQEELDRKCPGELRELDGLLRTTSLLQDQISECLSAQAQVKLQLLNAELTAFDLKMRFERECEQRSRVEEEIRDLRLLKQELSINQLPELQSLLHEQKQQMEELQQQHQQEMQGFLSQVSGAVTVEMQTAESSDLIQQLDDMRQTSEALLDKKQNQSWFKTQASMSSPPEVTFVASVESQVDQTELKDVRRTAARLTEELTQQQTLITQLQVYGQEQTESFVLKLRVLQQTVDSLCGDLDSVLQATAKQTKDHQSLLDVKNQLEAEIQDYRRLLDEMTQQGVFSSSIKSTPAATSGYVTPSPDAFMKNPTADTAVSGQKENLSRTEVQVVSKGHVRPVGQTKPLPETITTVQSIRVHSNHPKNSQVASANTLNMTFQNMENGKTTEQESVTINTTANKQSSHEEDRVHVKDLQVSSVVETQVFKTSDSRAVVSSSKTETICPVVPECSSASKTEPETFTIKTDTNPQAEIETKNITSAEPDTKQEPPLETTTDPGKPAVVEILSNVSNNLIADAETGSKTAHVSPGIHDNSDNTERTSTEILKVDVDEVEVANDNNKLLSDNETVTVETDVSGLQESTSSVIDPDVALSFSNPEELPKPDKQEMCPHEDQSIKINQRPNNSDIHVSPVEPETLMDDENIERKEKESDGTSLVPRLDQSLALSTSTTEESNREPSGCADSSGNNDRKTTEMTEMVNVVCGIQDTNEANAQPSEEDNEFDVQADQEVSKWPISSLEECLSPQDAEELILQTKEKCLSPETCMSPTETEVLLSLTDHVFCPVDPEENINGSDLPLSQNEPEMVPSSNDPDSCLSPAEVVECLSPNGEEEEEDEEAGLSLTEANAHVKPVEKYILSTKETGQSLSFSADQGFKEDRNTHVRVLERNEDCLSFRSFEGTEGSPQVRHSLESGGPDGPTDTDKDTSVMADHGKKNDTQVVKKPGDSERVFGKPVRSSMSSDGGTAFSSTSQKPEGIPGGNVQTNTTQGRARQGSGEWLVYDARVGRTGSSLPNTRSKESLSSAASQPETGRFGGGGSGEWIVYGGGHKHKSSQDSGTKLSRQRKEENSSDDSKFATSPPDTGRFKRRGSDEWMVYGSLGRKSSLTGSDDLSNRDGKDYKPTDRSLATSPPATGRFGSEGSGEWRVYGGSSGRLSSAGSREQVSVNRTRVMSPPGSYTSSGPRLCSAGSGGKLSSGSVVRRSSSVGSGGRLNSSGSGGRISSSSGSYRISSTGRYSSTSSGEWKPVYSSGSGRKSSVGSTGGGRTTSSQRAPSPGGRMGMSGGSGGWLSSAATGNRISSADNGNNHSSTRSNDRISNQGAGGRISSSSGSGRSSSTSGRVISSSDWPVRSSGSGAGGNKERISVCKMAALSISAAGRERSQERQRQRSQQQQAAVASPLVQRWLTTGVGVTSTDPEGLDDIMHL